MTEIFKLQTRITRVDTGLRAAPTALSASLAALLGLSIHCVPCHGASIVERQIMLGAKTSKNETSSPFQASRIGYPRSLAVREPENSVLLGARFEPRDRQKQGHSATDSPLSPLVRLAEQLTPHRSDNSASPQNQQSDATDTSQYLEGPDIARASRISHLTTTPVEQQTTSSSPDLSPLIRLADQMAGPTTHSVAAAPLIAPDEIVEIDDETPITDSAEDIAYIGRSLTETASLPEITPSKALAFSPLVRLADQMASVAIPVATSGKTADPPESETFGEGQRAKNICANLPPIPDPAAGEAVPEVIGPRLPTATAETPTGPVESKLFDPNLLDEQPLDLETRIRNAEPQQQFAPPEPLSAPRPLPIVPEVAVKVPVVNPNRTFLEATVPGDVSMDARPFLRSEEFAINSEPGPFSQLHLGEKITLDWSGIGFGLIFDDNFTVSNGNPKADTLLTISSGLSLSLGSSESRVQVRAIYNASGVFFLNNSNENAFNQDLSFDMTYRMQRLTLGLHIRPSLITGSSVDAGDRVGRKLFYAGLTANYNLSDKMSISLNTDYAYASYEGLLTSRETRVQGFVNYLVTPKITLGLGGGYGVLNVDGGQTQTSQQALVQISYAATAKLAFNANAGWEFRDSADGLSTSSTPVFSLGAAWTPREKTTISVDARRRIYGSAALVGQNYQATGFSATITQQLRPRVSANLTVGYEFTRYTQALLGVDASRRDDYFFTRVGLGFPVNRWCSGNVFYEFSNNSSNGNGARSFDRNRVGMFLSCQF